MWPLYVDLGNFLERTALFILHTTITSCHHCLAEPIKVCLQNALKALITMNQCSLQQQQQQCFELAPWTIIRWQRASAKSLPTRSSTTSICIDNILVDATVCIICAPYLASYLHPAWAQLKHFKRSWISVDSEQLNSLARCLLAQTSRRICLAKDFRFIVITRSQDAQFLWGRNPNSWILIIISDIIDFGLLLCS